MGDMTAVIGVAVAVVRTLRRRPNQPGLPVDVLTEPV